MKLKLLGIVGVLLVLSVINVVFTTLIYNIFPSAELAQIESKFKAKKWGNYSCEAVRGQVERECAGGVFSERNYYMQKHRLTMLTPWTYKSEEGNTFALYWKNVLL